MAVNPTTDWSKGPKGPGWLLMFTRVTTVPMQTGTFGGLWDGSFEREYRPPETDDKEMELILTLMLLELEL